MAGPPSYPANANLSGQSPPSTMLGTPRATSITDDSETDYDPTPIHSPGGPQYEDLPPSYDEAQHQAVRGVAPIDPNQIEAHRLTLNEGPNEPEVWEYRVKGEEVDPADEREEAPDYANHTNDKATSVPVQHVSTSETIPVGRVQSVPARELVPTPTASTASVHNGAPPFEQTRSRAAEDHADPPHSIPGPSDDQWSSFGTCENSTGREGRGYGHWPGSQQQQGSEWGGNEWSEVGKDLGKMGEEFGKKMGNWGIEFGKRANAWGLDVGRMASGSGTQSRNAPRRTYEQPEDDLPPSYEAPAGQETGAFRGDSKVDTKSSISTSGPSKSKGKDKDDYDDDDSSSISSDSSDSDSDSDSDYDDYPDTEAMFAKRMRSINEQADASAEKGKKSAEEIAHERAMAIEKAEKDKEAMDLKIATKLSKRMSRRDLKQRKRELKRQHRQRKRELRAAHTGKGKGKVKKSTEWREAKKEYKEEKKKLRKETLAAKKQWREARENSRREEWRDSKGGC